MLFCPNFIVELIPFQQSFEKRYYMELGLMYVTSFHKTKVLTFFTNLLLTHYNSSIDIVVSDASNYRVGDVIFHVFPDGRQKAVDYAFRSLTPSECNYSQIEKEALVNVFAIKRFHKTLNGAILL